MNAAPRSAPSNDGSLRWTAAVAIRLELTVVPSHATGDLFAGKVQGDEALAPGATLPRGFAH